jgi:ABC-2 type transport system permease protein
MTMNMFYHELKANGKSTAIWSCALACVAVLFLSFFSSFYESADEFQSLLEGFPPFVLKAFGINAEILTSFVGFYAFIFLYVVLCGAIQAMNLGTAAISKETTRKTADFILTKPVSRKQILTAKLLSVLASILITDVVFLISAVVMERIMNDGKTYYKEFILITASLVCIQLFFVALGFLVSVIANKIKSVISVSLSTVFGFFIVKMIGDALDEEKLQYFSPFSYFDSNTILRHGGYETRFLIISLVFVVLALAASYVIYTKKDIHAV